MEANGKAEKPSVNKCLYSSGVAGNLPALKVYHLIKSYPPLPLCKPRTASCLR